MNRDKENGNAHADMYEAPRVKVVEMLADRMLATSVNVDNTDIEDSDDMYHEDWDWE